MPVKLFEYMSFGLPVVTTDCVETANFVNRNNVGLVSKDNPQDYAKAIASLYNAPGSIPALRENCLKSLRQGNLWVHRAQKAAEDILA